MSLKQDDPIELWDYLNKYFTNNAAVFVSNLKRELAAVKREKGENVDAVVAKIRQISGSLTNLGHPESDESLKQILVNALLNSTHGDSERDGLFKQLTLGYITNTQFKINTFENN